MPRFPIEPGKSGKVILFSAFADLEVQSCGGHGRNSTTIASCQDVYLDRGAAVAERIGDGGDGQRRATPFN